MAAASTAAQLVDEEGDQAAKRQNRQPFVQLRKLLLLQTRKRRLPQQERLNQLKARNKQQREQQQVQPTVLEEARPFNLLQHMPEIPRGQEDQRRRHMHCEPRHLFARQRVGNQVENRPPAYEQQER